MSRRSVGIVTIIDDENFGNRLQNYALEQAIQSLGWEPETIRNEPAPMSRRRLIARTGYAIRRDPIGFAVRNTRLALARLAPANAPARAQHAHTRRRAIAAFSARHVHITDQGYADRPADWWAQRYHTVVTGSDQVWNPGFRNAHGFDFLDFAAPSQRISYAASFGVHDVPEYLRRDYTLWLSQIPHLSVREERAAEIVAELTGRDVPVVLDPTLLVDRSVWDDLLRDRVASMPSQPYAVRFFLGRPSVDQERFVDMSTRRSGLAVHDLNDLTREKNADLDPAGFIAMLSTADQVFTDSFHAAVFSVLYGRPLVVRDRHGYDSRIRNLMKLHGLELRPTGVAGLSAADPAGADAADRRHDHQANSWHFLREALGTAPLEN